MLVLLLLFLMLLPMMDGVTLHKYTAKIYQMMMIKWCKKDTREWQWKYWLKWCESIKCGMKMNVHIVQHVASFWWLCSTSDWQFSCIGKCSTTFFLHCCILFCCCCCCCWWCCHGFGIYAKLICSTRLQIKYQIYWKTFYFHISSMKWWENVKFAVGIKFRNCGFSMCTRALRVGKDEKSIQHSCKIHWHNKYQQRIRSNVHRMHFYQIMRVTKSKEILTRICKHLNGTRNGWASIIWHFIWKSAEYF